MESLLDFIKGMDGVTLALIGLGVILVFPALYIFISSKIKDIAGSLGGFIKKVWDSKPIVKPVPTPVYQPASMTELVSLWEQLHDGCAENDLSEACAKLDEVWPHLSPSNNMVVK